MTSPKKKRKVVRTNAAGRRLVASLQGLVDAIETGDTAKLTTRLHEQRRTPRAHEFSDGRADKGS
jgi:hypothetical protein